MADKLLRKFKKSAFAITPESGYNRVMKGIPESALPFILNSNVINLPGSNPTPNEPSGDFNNGILTENGNYLLAENGMFLLKE